MTRRRLQLNLSSETEAKLDAIYESMKGRGPQREIKKSEIISALIDIAYQNKTNIDLSGLAPRGRWGSKDADKFVEGLGARLKDAIS